MGFVRHTDSNNHTPYALPIERCYPSCLESLLRSTAFVSICGSYYGRSTIAFQRQDHALTAHLRSQVEIRRRTDHTYFLRQVFLPLISRQRARSTLHHHRIPMPQRVVHHRTTGHTLSSTRALRHPPRHLNYPNAHTPYPTAGQRRTLKTAQAVTVAAGAITPGRPQNQAVPSAHKLPTIHSSHNYPHRHRYHPHGVSTTAAHQSHSQHGPASDLLHLL